MAGFPTRAEAAENLTNALAVLKRPWYLILLALAGALLIACSATGNDQAMKVTAVVSAVILLTAMKVYGMTRR